MNESVPRRFERWRLQDVLLGYPGLRVAPSQGDGLRLVGELHFRVAGPDAEPIEDSYEVEICVSRDFPRETPLARETGGRIAPTYHKLKGGFLCLGAPTELQIRLVTAPTLMTFTEQILIPYLYGHTYFQTCGVMPFDELEHGVGGLLQHFATLFRAPSRPAAREFVRLASVRRRIANRSACPCGSGQRLGRCHNREVNRLRGLLGRPWFRRQLGAVENTERRAYPRVQDLPSRNPGAPHKSEIR